MSAYDASVLASDLALARLFRDGGERREEAEERRELDPQRSAERAREAGKAISDCPIPPDALDELVNLIDDGKINGKQGKEVFAEMFATGKAAGGDREGEGIEQLSDAGAIEALCDQVIAGEPEAGGRLQGRERRVDQLPQRPGDEAFPGQSQSAARG